MEYRELLFRLGEIALDAAVEAEMTILQQPIKCIKMNELSTFLWQNCGIINLEHFQREPLCTPFFLQVLAALEGVSIAALTNQLQTVENLYRRVKQELGFFDQLIEGNFGSFERGRDFCLAIHRCTILEGRVTRRFLVV